MKFKLEVTYLEFKVILAALLTHSSHSNVALSLIEKLHAQDPANDGPEVTILTGAAGQ